MHADRESRGVWVSFGIGLMGLGGVFTVGAIQSNGAEPALRLAIALLVVGLLMALLSALRLPPFRNKREGHPVADDSGARFVQHHSGSGNNYAAETMLFHQTPAAPEISHAVLERNAQIGAGYTTAFAVQIDQNYAVDRILLKGVTTRNIAIMGASVRRPDGGHIQNPSASLTADGALPGVTYTVDRPPHQFIFTVSLAEPDEVSFDCERI